MKLRRDWGLRVQGCWALRGGLLLSFVRVHASSTPGLGLRGSGKLGS